MFKNIKYELKEGVRIYSKPLNHNLYDLMWETQYQNQQKGIESFGKDRVYKLKELFMDESLDFTGKIILDAPCGLGRISLASQEIGADLVVACDGSFNGPKYTNLRMGKKNIIPIQMDLEDINNIFEPQSFDIIIHYFALQHMRDYKQVLSSFASLLKKGGKIGFNFFITGQTSQITYNLRDYFMKYDLSYVENFLASIGRIKGKEKEKKIDLIKLNELNLTEFYQFKDILNDIRELNKKYSIGDIMSKIHLEDFQTTYLWNFSNNKIVEYVKSLGLKILNNDFPGRISAQRIR